QGTIKADVAGGTLTLDGTGAASAIAASPTGATEAGTTVTIATTVAHGFAVGQTVVIAGVGVAGYNGTFTVTSVPSPTTFTYAAAAGLAASGGGTATGISTLNLGGRFATGGLGTLTRTGGNINLTGTLNNAGALLQLGAAPVPGSWNLMGGTIVGGT